MRNRVFPVDPVRLKGLTPDEFERLCLEIVRRLPGTDNVMRRGGISDPDQGIDIEALVGAGRVGIQCKTGKVTVPILRGSLRQLIRFCMSDTPIDANVNKNPALLIQAKKSGPQIFIQVLWL